MASIVEITQRPLSGLNHIDALLGSGQPWNYIARDTINFSFALDATGDPAGTLLQPQTLQAFSVVQQEQARAVLAYVSQVTGIAFSEVATAAAADLHFGYADLHDGFSSQNISRLNFATVGDQAADVEVDAWVYLDSNEDAADNAVPTPGSFGYESLLHEIGHALGMKHTDEGPQVLPPGNAFGQDNTTTTLMSQNIITAPSTSYTSYDLAALQWLYGGDGLRGALGVAGAGKSVVGTGAADTLRGDHGNDRFVGEGGNDIINAGTGLDTAVFHGTRAQYQVQVGSGGSLSITGPDGADTLAGVERVKFDDFSMAFDINGTAGQAYRIYGAAFDRAPDFFGLGYWMQTMDAGQNDLLQVARFFASSAEFSATYGSLNTAQFVTQLYANVLNRAPDAGGLAFHVNTIESGALDRGGVLVNFSESPENQALLIGAIQNGIVYTG